MLKRYLRSHYDMSPEEYRRKWGLPPDYPMVAPAYAARRSDFAKKIGLGTKPRKRPVQRDPEDEEEDDEVAPRRAKADNNPVRQVLFSSFIIQ